MADFNEDILLHRYTFLDYIRFSFLKQFQTLSVVYRYHSVTSVAVWCAAPDSEVYILKVSSVLQWNKLTVMLYLMVYLEYSDNYTAAYPGKKKSNFKCCLSVLFSATFHLIRCDNYVTYDTYWNYIQQLWLSTSDDLIVPVTIHCMWTAAFFTWPSFSLLRLIKSCTSYSST
jgi:hypothetical protein